MTKKLLLVAASVGTLAFVGAASAADLTVSLAGNPVTVGSPYVIGDIAEGTLVGVLEAEATYVDVIPLANNLLITLRLANGATFAAPVGITNIDLRDADGNSISNQQKTVSDGGGAGSDFVTYLVSTPSDAIKSVRLGDFTAGDGGEVKIKFAAKAKPTVAIETKTEFGTAIEGGSAKFGSATAASLVDYDTLVTVAIDKNSQDAVLSLATDPIFSQFNVGGAAPNATTANLGTISVDLNDVYLPAAASAGIYNLTSDKVTPAAVKNLEIEYEGKFGGTTGVSLTPMGTVLANGVGSTVYAAPVVATLTGAESKLASDYRARVTVNYFDYDAYVSPYGDLASIKRDGVAAEVPWVASSALAALNQSRSIIRVANKSTQPANVYVEYVTSAAAQGLTPDPIVAKGEPVLVGTVGAQSDLQISNAKLTSLLGEFVRGNVIVTVEAKKDEITVNNRISYVDGKVEETTIIPR